MIIFIVSIIIAAIAVLAIVGMNVEKIGKAQAIFILSLSAVCLLILSVCRIIPTGYTGVRTTFGQAEQKVLDSGIHCKIPFVQSIHKMNNKQQDWKYKERIWGEASDKTVVYAQDVIVTFQINPEKSSYIYANVDNYKNNLIPQTLVSSAVKSAMVLLPSDKVTNRNEIEPLAKTILEQAIIEKYNDNAVYILKVTIDDMDFEDSYNDAIAQKQIARQEAEKQAIENQKMVDMAKSEQEKATIEAETKKIAAQADADAMLISAEAEAEAYRIKSAEITDNLLKKWELDARKEHGWVTIQGANAIVTGK